MDVKEKQVWLLFYREWRGDEPLTWEMILCNLVLPMDKEECKEKLREYYKHVYHWWPYIDEVVENVYSGYGMAMFDEESKVIIAKRLFELFPER